MGLPCLMDFLEGNLLEKLGKVKVALDLFFFFGTLFLCWNKKKEGSI